MARERTDVDLLELVEGRRARIYDDARPDAVARQHASGKLTARERVALLVDDGTFAESGTLVEPRRDTPPTAHLEAPADGVVTGVGTVEGRPVGVVATDYTVYGGSFGTIGGLKVERVAQTCLRHGFPLVQLHDGGGHRIQEALESRHSASGTGNWMHFPTQARLSGWVPMANAVLGPGFAGPSNFSALADYVVMVEGQSTMGAAGPALVLQATGEDLTNEELGGTAVQVDRHGVADLAAPDEPAAIESLRRFLGYLPSNAGGSPPAADPDRPLDARAPELRDAVPANLRRAYDVKRVIEGVIDEGSGFELKPAYAPNVVTLLGRLGGRVVGVMANQPKQRAGAITSPACEKLAHFISLCDAYGIPLISLIDTPGLLVGPGAEQTALVRRSGRVIYELGRATVPLLVVALRKGYGLGYVMMGGGREFEADLCVAWPTAHLCGIQVEGAVDVAYRKAISEAEDPAAERARLIAMYEAQVGILQAAESFAIDDVIDPQDTRRVLGTTLARLPERKLSKEPPRRHGISPI